MLHTMRIQRPLAGDELVTWKANDEASVAAAKEAFDKALAEGKRAFRMERKEQVTEFDPSHQEILIVAPLSGG